MLAANANGKGVVIYEIRFNAQGTVQTFELGSP